MAGGIKLDYSEVVKAAQRFANIPKQVEKNLETALKAGAEMIASTAKSSPETPVDMGGLRAHISAARKGKLSFEITVNTPYAAFVEFGTGRYAAAYVSTLPANWQAYAATFRGQKGNGGLDEFLNAMIEWVKRKGLIGLTKSGNRRTGKKADNDAYNLAYVIVINILRNGVHPHPFLYPAFVQNDGKIRAMIEAAVKEGLK